MRTLWTALALASLLALPPLVGLAPLPAQGAGGGGSMGGGDVGSASGGPRRSPDQIAQRRYEKGLKKRDNALEHEQAAAQASSDAAREKSLGKARKDWEAAIELYQSAIEKKADLHEAWSDMGYAQRKLGRYEESLASYDKALALEPSYPQALEYVGEAYLALNRIDDAKRVYLRLFSVDRPLASQLMTALEGWAGRAQASPPAGVDAQALQEFLTWIRERRELAAQVGEVSAAKPW
jgi:tetratricopeptide (TPR) repeat protein